MSQANQALTFSQKVNASPAHVYYAFTNGSALREWLCDSSQVVPSPGGRLYLWWHSGYYTAGEYLTLEPDRKLTLSWQGRGEPGPTQVQVSLEAEAGGTQVKLEHRGIGRGAEWDQPQAEIRRGWVTGLENLASVLETGEDLRFVRRPMLGILLNDFSAEIAEHLGVPVQDGVRLDGTVAGMGAQAAGLRADDVIVGMAGGPIKNYADLAHILQAQRAGDQIEVVYYRGGDRQVTMMELSGRPIPEIPSSIQELSGRAGAIFEEQESRLEELFEGVTEAEASHHPAPGEWSAKEILAHLILGERDNGAFIAELVGGFERTYDDFGTNSHERTKALVTVYPTVNELLDLFKRTNAETAAFLAGLPGDFITRKGSFWRLAYATLGPPFHSETHQEQIRSAIASAKAGTASFGYDI
jgi:uncharacterized protein YndB with AHSA1/START domain